MSIRNLDALLKPRSVALVGASQQPGSLGTRVLANLVAAGFDGPIYAVSPHPIETAAVIWAETVDDLPAAPDLAVLMTPAETVPAIIGQLGSLGTRCAVVLSAGVSQESGLRQKMLDAAERSGLRIIGPNCLGVIAPHSRLDTSFARTQARPGRLALISQSGALVTAMLDWADRREIGFSAIVSVGDMAEVDVGDLISLFARDPNTDAILLYVEGLSAAAKFMSAARAAACDKPIIAIKAGRSPAAAAAALSHSGALAGAYDVYRAAFDRAGIVTVDTLTQLFDAAEILTAYRSCTGDRLGIVTNGGGAGILAVDALAGAHAELATLSKVSLAELDAALPVSWSHANPVDIVGDATPERYRDAISTLLRDDGVDALLVMNCPTAMAPAAAFAEVVGEAVQAARAAGISKPVIGCWLGDANMSGARATLKQAGIPLYSMPEDAVGSLGYLLAATRARVPLIDAAPGNCQTLPDTSSAKAIIARARADNRTLLTEVEAMALLAAYRIPVVPMRFATAPETICDAIGGLAPPYAVKIVSPDISHKSDAGGVALGLSSRKAAAGAACAMETRIRFEHPDARIFGYAVETMVERKHSHELIAGIATDPLFGPLLLFGSGGTAVEVVADKALALPPINKAQARAMIEATHISKLLVGYRREPAANIEAVTDVLGALSAMAAELPDIVELDINPLLADPAGVVALDARIRISRDGDPAPRLAIQPAPPAWTADMRDVGMAGSPHAAEMIAVVPVATA